MTHHPLESSKQYHCSPLSAPLGLGLACDEFVPTQGGEQPGGRETGIRANQDTLQQCWERRYAPEWPLRTLVCVHAYATSRANDIFNLGRVARIVANLKERKLMQLRRAALLLQAASCRMSIKL